MIKWKDIDFNKKRIFVQHSLYYISGQGLVLQTPSGKRNKKQAQLLKVGLKLIEDHFVVSAFDGELVNPNTIHKQLLYDSKLAGMKRTRFHDLRHTHATIMLEIGENSKMVSERLGHSNVSITLDKYSHVTQNIQDSSAENFSKALGKKSMDQ
ncbi:site-specific integrase [Peribacillus butanolivorans]|uniref:site-specific integrase n=1 Tax=Peribacillus butanolivorans TaxID=421767 RepID=UPI003665A260